MPLTDEEKRGRKARAKRRREAKASGTWVPPKERKTRKRKDLSKRISSEASQVRSKEEIKQVLKHRRKTETKRLGVRFKIGEPVLIKAQIQGHIASEEPGGRPRYYVEPITALQRGYDPTKGNPEMKRKSWVMTESFLVPWPKRGKRKAQ